MEHLGYLFAAYSVIFILIALYGIFIARRQARLEREVTRIEVSLRNAEMTASALESDSQDLNSPR
jgi:CcmD family protein